MLLSSSSWVLVTHQERKDLGSRITPRIPFQQRRLTFLYIHLGSEEKAHFGEGSTAKAQVLHASEPLEISITTGPSAHSKRKAQQQCIEPKAHNNFKK